MIGHGCWQGYACPLAILWLTRCDPTVVVGSDAEGSFADGGGAGAAAAQSVAGAAGSVAVAGTPPVPWFATHESGSLEEWLEDGFGWEYTIGGGELTVSNERSHTGNRSLKSSLGSAVGLGQGVVGRYAQLVEGYYSAWFYLPTQAPLLGRVIMKLSAYEPDANVFDITALLGSDGQLHLTLFDHGVGENVTDPESAPMVPLDSWFEIVAFYRSTGSSDGRVVIWQDAQRVIDTGIRATGPSDRVTLIVGSVSRVAQSQPIDTYVDDASISAGTLAE